MKTKKLAEVSQYARENDALEGIVKTIPKKDRSQIYPEFIESLKLFLHGLSDKEMKGLQIAIIPNKNTGNIAIICKLSVEKDAEDGILIRDDGAMYPCKYSLAEFADRLSIGRNYENSHECIKDYLRNPKPSLYPS